MLSLLTWDGFNWVGLYVAAIKLNLWTIFLVLAIIAIIVWLVYFLLGRRPRP